MREERREGGGSTITQHIQTLQGAFERGDRGKYDGKETMANGAGMSENNIEGDKIERNERWRPKQTSKPQDNDVGMR